MVIVGAKLLGPLRKFLGEPAVIYSGATKLVLEHLVQVAPIDEYRAAAYTLYFRPQDQKQKAASPNKTAPWTINPDPALRDQG